MEECRAVSTSEIGWGAIALYANLKYLFIISLNERVVGSNRANAEVVVTRLAIPEGAFVKRLKLMIAYRPSAEWNVVSGFEVYLIKGYATAAPDR
jgi:hypothetical protein